MSPVASAPCRNSSGGPAPESRTTSGVGRASPCRIVAILPVSTPRPARRRSSAGEAAPMAQPVHGHTRHEPCPCRLDDPEAQLPPPIPCDRSLDSTPTLLAEGYEFVGNRCRRYGSDLFETRLMLRRAVCATGAEAARVFYE